MQELVKLTKIRQALAEVKTLEEIRNIRDVARAVRAYAEAKKLGIEMKNEAAEIEIRAIREMGKLLQQKQEAGEVATQKDGALFRDLVPGENKVIPQTLNNIGITRKESSTSKNIASISDEVFEEKINEFIANKKPLTKTALLRDIAKINVKTNVEMPGDTYRIIYADPPWRYNDLKTYRPEGAAENHYPTMSIEELCEMELPKLEENAILFIWVTSPMLEESFKVINSWGFKYKSSFVWDKISHNMGHYNSVRHEFLLISTKGSCLPDVKKLYDSVISEERAEHSAKPEIFRKIIDELYPNGKRIELFARRKTEGWDSFGNQL